MKDKITKLQALQALDRLDRARNYDGGLSDVLLIHNFIDEQPLYTEYLTPNIQEPNETLQPKTNRRRATKKKQVRRMGKSRQ